MRDRARGAGLACFLLALAACQPAESDLPPDRRLQSQLGLDPRDRVHEVVVSANVTGVPEPRETVVLAGDYLQFVTADSWVHELIFESDSLTAEALAFMTDLDQMASPPLVSRGSRFVVSFVGAPAGRYPFRVEGSHPAAHGAIVVETPAAR
jgi:plastocyanin